MIICIVKLVEYKKDNLIYNNVYGNCAILYL